MIESSSIKISRRGKRINYDVLSKMSGNDLLSCEIEIKNHKVDFYEGSIPFTGGFSGKPIKNGIGYNYWNGVFV